MVLYVYMLWNDSRSSSQLTLETHGFELHRSTYTQIFSITVLEKFFEISDNLKKLTNEPYSLEMLKQLRKNYVMDSWNICRYTYSIQLYVNLLFMLSVRLLVDSRLLVIKLNGSKSLMWVFHCLGLGGGGQHP